MNLEELSQRLDKQAAAIRRLRADRDALAARVDALVAALGEGSASPSRVTSPDPSTYAPYIPSTLCLMCGELKEPGRTAMTCRPCTATRQEIIRDGTDRAAITRTSCASCSAPFKPQTRFLCTPCSKGHKIWAASQ